MITQTELNQVLIEINKILDGLNKRITDLEQAQAPIKKPTPSKS